MILHKLRRMAIAVKLPLTIVGLGGIIAASVGIAAYLTASTTTDVINPSGAAAIAAFAPIEFAGVTWAIVAQMTKDEILASANTLLCRVVGITAVAPLCLTLVGWGLGRNIGLPLQRLVVTVASLARGERAEIPGADRTDEIGSLARSLAHVPGWRF